MSPANIRKTLRTQRKAVRQRLRALQERTRQRVQQIPAVRRERTRRRVRRLVAVCALLLLALLMRCDCDKNPQGQRPASAPAKRPEPAKPRPKIAKDKRSSDRTKMQTQPRNKFAGAAQAPAAWLDDFRLQVAARSPRLAQCFTGTDKPGALRWTAALNADSGAVSDHQIEPIAPSGELKREQYDCLTRILSDPRYKLKPAVSEVLPDTIALVIEF